MPKNHATNTATRPVRRRRQAPESIKHRIEVPYTRYSRLKSLLGTFWIGSLILFFMGLHVYQSAAINNLKYEIRLLSQKSNKLIQQNSELRVKVVQNGSAERIERLYKLRYGYIPVQSKFRIKKLVLPRIGDTTIETSGL